VSDNIQIARLYQMYSPAVFGCAYSILRNRAAAEDITQAIFLKLLHYDDTANPIKNHKTWLIVATRNLAYNYIRDNKRELSPEGHGDIVADGFEEQAIYSIEIQKALDVLNDIEQQLFMLHYLDRYKYRELSEIFSIPVGTVKTHCHTPR